MMIGGLIIPKVLHLHTNQWYIIGPCIPKRDKLFATCYCLDTKGTIIVDMDHLVDVLPATEQELFTCYQHNKHDHDLSMLISSIYPLIASFNR